MSKYIEDTSESSWMGQGSGLAVKTLIGTLNPILKNQDSNPGSISDPSFLLMLTLEGSK